MNENLMDRFKLRVFDTINRKYGLSVYCKHGFEDIQHCSVTSIVPPASDNPSQFIIEQSTGKYSKREQLIFEGNILVMSDPYHATRIVRWYNGNMVLTDREGYITDIDWDGLQYTAVGNVLEGDPHYYEKVKVKEVTD